MVVWRWFTGLFLCWFRGCYRSVVRLFCGGLRAVVWWLSRVEVGAAENGGGSRSCREEEKELKCWKKWDRPCVRELRGAASCFLFSQGLVRTIFYCPSSLVLSFLLKLNGSDGWSIFYTIIAQVPHHCFSSSHYCSPSSPFRLDS